MSQQDSSRFAIGAQAYYPGQAYNTPAMLQLAASINASQGRLLDIGCGDGQLLKLLAERFPDIELAGLTVSEDERRVCGERFDVRVGDMHVLPWRDAAFDAVVSRHSLEHSISPLTALFEVNRVLRLDGVFHAVVPAPVSEWVVKWKDHFSVLPRPMWEKLFDDAGFAVEHYEDGAWLASFSMQQEAEMRFVLRKVRDIESRRVSSQEAELMPVQAAPAAGVSALSTLVERRIVVVLHNLVLFDAIRPVVARFGKDVKFLVPLTGDAGFDAMGEHTSEGIAVAGFEVERAALPADVRCDIELSPYPYAPRNVTKAKWRVRFMYGLAKEAWNFSLENNAYYDFVLAYGDYDARVLSAYSTPVRVGNPKIEPVQHAANGERPVLLYLPTYGPTSSIEAVSRIQSQLKTRFRVVAKAHHGTTYLEPERTALLQTWVDELAHHDTGLSSLLASADVVLSDGSGAIFDAIAAGVPVAVFQDRVFGGLCGAASLEERLVRDALIPATSVADDIPATLDRAIQAGVEPLAALRRELFAALGDEAAARAAAFVSELLSGSAAYDTFAIARRTLQTQLAEGGVQRHARQVAERQLDETYRNLTDRLLADLQAALARVAERDRQVSDLSAEIQHHVAHIAQFEQERHAAQAAFVEREARQRTAEAQLVHLQAQLAHAAQAREVLQHDQQAAVAALAERDLRFATLERLLEEQAAHVRLLEMEVADAGQRETVLANSVTALHRQVAEADARLAAREAESAAQIVALRAQVASGEQALAEQSIEVARLNRALALESDRGVRTRAELQAVGEHLRAQLLEISDWASRIDARPATYALKKTALGVARGTLRAMPVSIATKQRLRDAFFSTLRPLRASVHRKSAGAHPAETLPAVPVPQSFAGVPRDAFVFAVIDWHFRIQRPQHIARSLAEGGRRVFYFSNHFVDADAPGYQLERLPGADALYQIKLHVKGAPAIYFAPPTDDALTMLELSIARVIQDFGALSSLSVVQHAYWYPLVKRLPNSYRIYDCMDHHEGFGNVPEQLVAIEREMLGGADLVTVTSSWLDDFARGYNPNVALVRNAAEFPHFVTRPEQVYADAQGRRIIGYYGAIAEWFDLDLVRAVARAYPDCLVLLVGDDTVGAGKALADLPNVTFTGEVPYATLPFYLHAFDVCLLPFKVIPLTLATNPVKVYEYLAAGKPVVCVDLPEVGQFGDRVARSLSFDAFVADVGAALAESGPEAEQKAAERRRFASEQTWRQRGEELAAALAAVRMPRVSVIILTFNNLELTRACLDSILERSDYPNLEVIVVDNASSDDTPSYLEDFARRHPDVRVVLNRENLGFAAGNNVGMSIATGDYLVVLNNDTVVTQGWVMTLLRHFEAQPGLGLVGPVTNNIGNEARIEISYPDIAQMPGEALRYTLSHMGQRYPMRNAAFFCVMMPRSTYECCGPISEDYGRGFFEDDDYCRKVEAAGLAIACADDVFVHHHLSASFSKLKDAERQALFERNKAVYEQKWGAWEPHAYRP